MHRVTILMPVYNGERFLKETMDSVLSQTFTDFVFMIINDGSTDKTEDIIKSYPDNRILYIENERNMGLVDTLNKGIELTQTEYLARMDADDLWESTKLEKQIRLMGENKDIGLCGTSIHKFGNINGDFIFPENNDQLKVGFLFYCTMSHPSVVFRMSMLKEIGLRYKKDFFPAEDYKMWVDCLKVTTVYNIPEVLVYYRQHEEQICQAKTNIQREKTDLVRLEMLRNIYPKVTDEEIKFHLEEFVTYKINSKDDIVKHQTWVDKLLRENEKNGAYIQQNIMKKEIQVYLKASIKGYILTKYFEKKSIRNYFRYLLSGDMKYLSIKTNLGILKNILKS